MGFIKGQRNECEYRRDVCKMILFGDTSSLIYVSLSGPPIIQSTTMSSDTQVAPCFLLRHLALRMCHILLKVSHTYCCLLGQLAHVPFLHSTMWSPGQ